MNVQGCDCSIVIKTAHCEMDIPYTEETIRDAVSILQEEAAIEGDGVCRALRKKCGVTGCVVTPLTIGTAPLLLYLAMGSMGKPVFISETRDLFQYQLSLLPLEDTDCFDLIQDRCNERRLYENCRVQGFELRFLRGETVKLKMDVCGEIAAIVYPHSNSIEIETGERFNGDYVTYRINGKEYKNIYGLTLSVKKEGGTKTELWIRRSLDKANDIPEIIEELTISAQLVTDKYEKRHFGTFRITIKRLVLISDETKINSTDTVLGSLRYFVSGNVATDVFTSGENAL
jgi:hypothetical protein